MTIGSFSDNAASESTILISTTEWRAHLSALKSPKPTHNSWAFKGHSLVNIPIPIPILVPLLWVFGGSCEDYGDHIWYYFKR